MDNNKSEKEEFFVKRKKILADVSEEIANSDDDDVGDGMEVCKVIQNQQIQVANSSALQALGETIRNTLLEVNTIREQNRERRHKELMQMLSKIVQQENIKSQSLNSNEGIPESGCTENATTKANCENNNQTHTNSANASKDISSKCKNNQPQVCKIKNGIATKKDDKELQQMRTQMLELQRKKMEDRERKKREFTRVLNV